MISIFYLVNSLLFLNLTLEVLVPVPTHEDLLTMENHHLKEKVNKLRQDRLVLQEVKINTTFAVPTFRLSVSHHSLRNLLRPWGELTWLKPTQNYRCTH
jgi:hypothetical protein